MRTMPYPSWALTYMLSLGAGMFRLDVAVTSLIPRPSMIVSSLYCFDLVCMRFATLHTGGKQSLPSSGPKTKLLITLGVNDCLHLWQSRHLAE